MDVGPSGLGPPRDEAPEADVGERAQHVGEDLDPQHQQRAVTVATPGLALVERRAPDPLLPAALLRNRTLRAAMAIAALCSAVTGLAPPI